MEKEEKIKTLSKKLYNVLINEDSSYEDFACTVTYLVFILDNIIHNESNTESRAFAKYVYNLIGEVCNLKEGN